VGPTGATGPAFSAGSTTQILYNNAGAVAGAAGLTTSGTSLAVSGVVSLAAGTAAAPSLTATGDTNTGLYFPVADTVAVTTGGTERVRVTSTTLSSALNIAFSRPSDFWTSGASYYSTGATQGGLSSEGSNAVALTSNGYRNNAGTWTSYGSGGATGASQIELLPTGEIRFRADTTKASGTAINPTQRMLVRGDGNIGIGASGSAVINIQLSSNITGATTSYGIRQIQTIQSDVTTTAFAYQTSISTVAASFALTNLRHFQAGQGTIGAGSTVQNQTGFFAETTMVGAASNFGFRGDIANATQRTITNVERTSNVVTITTSAAHGFTVGQSVLIAATTNTGLNGTFVITAVPLTTTLQYAQAGTDIVSVADTGTVNSANRFNLYMSGSAPNYLAGNLGIGTLTPTALLNVVANTATDAVRITQTGAGNALVVEDSANPDSSPFVVDADGRFIHGYTSALTLRGIAWGNLFAGIDASTSGLALVRYSANASPPILEMFKSRGASVSTNTVVQSGDSLGTFVFSGADGTDYIQGASITAAVDGTPGTSDMPGRLVFSTTADGAATPTERMRIDNAGNVGVGTSSFGTSAAGVIGIANGTAPTTSPAGMGQLYVEGGALKYRGSSGTVTTIANA
jgi:hypothetical protein